jgi:hypothetical protein
MVSLYKFIKNCEKNTRQNAEGQNGNSTGFFNSDLTFTGFFAAA